MHPCVDGYAIESEEGFLGEVFGHTIGCRRVNESTLDLLLHRSSAVSDGKGVPTGWQDRSKSPIQQTLYFEANHKDFLERQRRLKDSTLYPFVVNHNPEERTESVEYFA